MIWLLKHTCSHDCLIQVAPSHRNQQYFQSLTPLSNKCSASRRPSLFVSCYGHADWMQQNGNAASVGQNVDYGFVNGAEKLERFGLDCWRRAVERCQCVNRALGQSGTEKYTGHVQTEGGHLMKDFRMVQVILYVGKETKIISVAMFFPVLG